MNNEDSSSESSLELGKDYMNEDLIMGEDDDSYDEGEIIGES